MPALEIVVTLLLAAGQHPPLKHPTLLDQARERGGIERHSIGCGWAGRPALERLLRGPDVVIHGTILRAEGQLSDDEQEVWTRFTGHHAASPERLRW
jgi:hypothetical protein